MKLNECLGRLLLCIVALCAMVTSPCLAQSHRDQILEGVHAISSAGVPGPLAVFGDKAFPIVVGKLDKSSSLPVVVGAEWGKGHVIAFGHGGMIEADALKRADSAKLVVNAARWLMIDTSKPGAVVGNAALSQVLKEAGIDVVELDSNWQAQLDRYSFVVCDAHRLKQDMIAKLQSFIQSGGGFMTAGLGWGWLQLNPGKTLDDHPGNRLLRPCGIAWCDGSLEPGKDRTFEVTAVTAEFHARNALDALLNARTNGGKFSNQAATTLIHALRVLPEDQDLYAEARKIAESNSTPVLISQSKPLRAKDGVERVIVSMQVDMEKRAKPAEIKAHPSSAAFPGEVSADAPRGKRELEFDATVQGWHGTGLYAPAGEVIRVEFVESVPRAKVRIGCHTDELWHHDRWNRVPDIAREFECKGTSTQCASAFGGLIYIELPKQSAGIVKIRIHGAVASPRFVLGKTTLQEWKTERSNPAPWSELESDRVIISVPSATIRTLEDPEGLMQFWNHISDAHAILGGVQYPPSRPHRFVADIQISAGYMHSGYPIMTHLDAASFMTSLDTLKAGSWGLLHELGHNHQVSDWTFEGTGEVTCNLFALHAIDTVCTPKPGDRGHDAVNTPPSFEKYLAEGAKFEHWKKDPFLALHMYVQLEREFGWETFKRVFAEYRDLKKQDRPKNDDERRDQWMVRFSRACGKNLGPFFVKWGVPVSEGALQSITNLPEWMPSDWPQSPK